jgi:hypothetical protein
VGVHSSTGDTGDVNSVRYSIVVISATSRLGTSARAWFDSSFVGVVLELRVGVDGLLRLRQRQNDPMPIAIAANAPSPAPRPMASVGVLVAVAELAVAVNVPDIAFVERAIVALGKDDVALDAGFDDGSIVPTGNIEP